MATIEQIISEAAKLPADERRRLREALEVLDSTGDSEAAAGAETQPISPDISRHEDIRVERLEWLKSHRDEFGGQYIALEGVQLIAVGPTYRAARERARAAGKPNVFVTYLSKSDEIGETGGWV